MPDEYSLRDVAQPRCDDVVLAAAAFGPNAAGRRELSTIRGMSERQVLKSRASFLADRVLLAVTPLEVIAMALGPLSSRFREVLRWKRDSLVIRAIESHARVANVVRPAFLIAQPLGAATRARTARTGRQHAPRAHAALRHRSPARRRALTQRRARRAIGRNVQAVAKSSLDGPSRGVKAPRAQHRTQRRTRAERLSTHYPGMTRSGDQ